MNYEKFKQIISKNIFFKILVLALLIVILISYFKFFFTTGVYYDYKFLKKEVKSPDIHYIGNNNYDKIQITVKSLINEQNSIDVIYKLPNNINRHYIVSYKDLSNLGFVIEGRREKYKKLADGTYINSYIMALVLME